jgi:hypothetical protein
VNNTFFNCQIVETINQVDELIINNVHAKINRVDQIKEEDEQMAKEIAG